MWAGCGGVQPDGTGTSGSVSGGAGSPAGTSPPDPPSSVVPPFSSTTGGTLVDGGAAATGVATANSATPASTPNLRIPAAYAPTDPPDQEGTTRG